MYKYKNTKKDNCEPQGSYYSFICALKKLEKKIDKLYEDFCDLVKECLGISDSGDPDLVLNQKGEWVAKDSGQFIESVTDDGTGVVNVDNTDPYNPIVGFGGVYVLSDIGNTLPLQGNGTPGNPLYVDGDKLPANYPKWLKFTKTAADFATAATTNSIPLFTLPAKGLIQDVQVFPTNQFSGGTMTRYWIAINLYSPEYQVQVGQNGSEGAIASVASGTQSFSSPTTIYVNARSVGDTLNNVTNGAVDIYVLVSTLP